MYTYIAICISTFFVICYSTSLFAQTTTAPFVVVLDPGHGGSQRGAQNTEGLVEAEFVLDLALRIREQLADQTDITVLLTREEDIDVSLQERSAFANTHNATMFISLHANAAPSNTLYGIETYSMDVATDAFSHLVANRENNGMEDILDASVSINPNTMLLSLELAELMQRTVVEHISLEYPEKNVRNLGHKTAMFSVLLQSNMPSVLFEAGFVSNPTEQRHLRCSHYKDNLATAITMVILEWKTRNQ